MNVVVQSRTLVVTDALRNFVRRQTQRLVSRGHKIENVVVFLEKVKRKKNDMTATTAKFFINLPGKNIVVQERAYDLYLAIHEAARSAMRSIGETKDRRLSLRR